MTLFCFKNFYKTIQKRTIKRKYNLLKFGLQLKTKDKNVKVT